MDIRRYGRYWGVYDAEGQLVCVAVYKKGASEVVRRLANGADSTEVDETVTEDSDVDAQHGEQKA